MNRFENDFQKKTMTLGYVKKQLSKENLTLFERKNYESLKKSLEKELAFMNKEYKQLNDTVLD